MTATDGLQLILALAAGWVLVRYWKTILVGLAVVMTALILLGLREVLPAVGAGSVQPGPGPGTNSCHSKLTSPPPGPTALP